MTRKAWNLLLGIGGITAILVFAFLLWNVVRGIGSPPLLQKAEAMVGMPERKVIESLGPPVRVLTREQILKHPETFPGETYRGDLSVPLEKVLEYHVTIGRVYLYIEKGRLVKVGTAWT